MKSNHQMNPSGHLFLTMLDKKDAFLSTQATVDAQPSPDVSLVEKQREAHLGKQTSFPSLTRTAFYPHPVLLVVVGSPPARTFLVLQSFNF